MLLYAYIGLEIAVSANKSLVFVLLIAILQCLENVHNRQCKFHYGNYAHSSVSIKSIGWKQPNSYLQTGLYHCIWNIGLSNRKDAYYLSNVFFFLSNPKILIQNTIEKAF